MGHVTLGCSTNQNMKEPDLGADSIGGTVGSPLELQCLLAYAELGTVTGRARLDQWDSLESSPLDTHRGWD